MHRKYTGAATTNRSTERTPFALGIFGTVNGKLDDELDSLLQRTDI